MNSSLRFLLIVVWVTTTCHVGLFGQQKPSLLPLTADSLSTGNYKDVFRNFFQLAFDRITGPQKEIQFTSNPFAVMARVDTSMLIDYNYYRYRHLRALNFSFAAKLDTSYKFNGFSSSVKYALINKRDETISREFVKNAFESNQENNRLNDSLSAFLTTLDIADPRRASYREQANAFFNGEKNFSQLEPAFQALIRIIAKELGLENLLQLLRTNPAFNTRQVQKLSYDSLRTLFQKGLLLTVGLSDTMYRDELAFSHVVLNTQLLKGISQPRNPVGLELDLRGALNFIDDTVKNGRDLQRSELSLEPGLNIVFKTRKNQYSWGELKLSAAYLRTLCGLYEGEKTDRFTFNGILRIRIINDIWIPLEFRFDPDTGNLFGFINVRFNFTGLKTFARNLGN